MTERRVFKYGYIFCKSVFLFTLLIRLDEMLEFPSLVLATALPLILSTSTTTTGHYLLLITPRIFTAYGSMLQASKLCGTDLFASVVVP